MAVGLIFELGMDLVLSLATTKRVGRRPRLRVPRGRLLSMQGTPGVAAHGAGMHVSVVMLVPVCT